MARRLAFGLVPVLAAALLVAAAVPAHVLAADITYGTPSATSTFLQGIRFSQPVVLGSPVDRVELLLTLPGASGEYVVEVQPPGTTGSTTFTYTWDATADQSLVPNSPITGRWRVRVAGAEQALPAGPPVTVTYADTRFTWRSAEQGIVRVHWYQGAATFGQQALRIATDAIATAEAALGVTETKPIDFFVYADAAAFRQALGPSTGEFVVGRAVPEIRTLFGLVTAGDISGSEIDVTIAHELTHIVFDTATHNPYHEPPHWLNEGVAKYLSEGYGASDRGLVSSAVSDGTLYPLTSLASAFPSGDAVFLAYAEADGAVDHIVRTYGKESLAKLVDSYAAGRTDDEAFQSALGMDAAAFDAAWFASVGATVPKPAGPSAAPAGPVPPGWGAGAGAVASPGSTLPAASGGSGGASGVGSAPDATAAFVGLGVIVLVVLVVLFVALRSRQRSVIALSPSSAGGPAGPPGAWHDDEVAPPPSWPSEAWSRPSPAAEPTGAEQAADAAQPGPGTEEDGEAAPSSRGMEGFHARFWGEDDTPPPGEASHPPQP
jgi:Peptidase MA superfamily